MTGKKEKSKVVFHEFYPTIYPRKLWVVKGASIVDVNKMFCDHNKQDFLITDENMTKSKAMVFKVMKRSTWQYGVMVMLIGKCDIGDVAHESVHVASCIFSDCGMSMGFDQGQDEHFAYLVGFAADCINQVRINKFRE